MNIDKYNDINKVTIAEFKVAIYNVEKEMRICLKNRNIRGFLEAFKMNLKLNKLLDKKIGSIGNENITTKKQL